MKITFIRPNLSPARSSDAMTPLVFAILAARTPADVELAFYDERLEPIPFDESNFPRVDRRSGPDLKPFAVGKKGLQWQRPIRIRPSLALVVLEPK